MTRRNLLTALASATAAQAQRPAFKTWKPKLGLLGRFSEGNLQFAKGEGFASIGLWADRNTRLDVGAAVTDQIVRMAKEAVANSGLHLSVVSSTQNHIDPSVEARRRTNAYYRNVIELAGKLGVAYSGTTSGLMPGRPLDEQVAEIVRVYTESYFPHCEKYKVRILWEPWAGGPNIATGPVAYEALFKAFGNSPYVGLQYDPSHLVWQMMDPIQCARDFADKIYDIHLKDTEILWPVLRKTGIHPWNTARWWRFRLPGFGAIDWSAFFTVLMEAGYQGAMNIEHEDNLYGWPYAGDDFSEEYKTGFRVAHRYLRQFLPS